MERRSSHAGNRRGAIEEVGLRRLVLVADVICATLMPALKPAATGVVIEVG